MQDLSTMTIEELADLRDGAIAMLEEKIAARQAELQAEMERVGGFMNGKPGNPKTKKLAARYRNPATGESWAGRGAVPAWLAQAEAEGKSREEFAAAA